MSPHAVLGCFAIVTYFGLAGHMTNCNCMVYTHELNRNEGLWIGNTETFVLTKFAERIHYVWQGATNWLVSACVPTLHVKHCK